MRLRPAMSMTDYLEPDDEVAGWRERERVKDRRRRRRDHRQRGVRRDPVRRQPPRRHPPRPPPEPEPEDVWSDAEDDDLLSIFDAALEQVAGRRRRRRFGADDAWSRAVRLSRNLRIQTAEGYRAAV